MARKKIREHDGKRLLKQHIKRLANIELALTTALVSADTDWKKLARENPWLTQEKLVAKPDMLFGKRGKNNLVLLNANLDEVEKFVLDRIGKNIELKGVQGTLTHFLIEPFIPHKDEYYISINSNREYDTIHFSLKGGIDVEENWSLVKHLDIPADEKLEDFDLEKVFGLNEIADEATRKKVLEFIKGVFAVFVDLDFCVLELNPFSFAPSGNIVPLDLVAEVDDCAIFKNMKKWGELPFPQPFGRTSFPEEKYIQSLDEKTGASLKLTILNPKGRLWLMVAGGGASVIFADTVADLGFGSELGNYGEYSGNPNEEETYNYAKTILSLATKDPDGRSRALLIGGGIANFTDVAKTFKGITHAIVEFKEQIAAAKLSIFVRRAGLALLILLYYFLLTYAPRAELSNRIEDDD